MSPLAEPALKVVYDGKVKFEPERFTKTYTNWMENVHDWCISRQLWWGHRIPAFYCDACGEMTVSKTGTYNVYWSAFRSSTSGSYTFGTQLYIDGVAHGTQNTTWSNHVQNNHLTNVSLTANQKLRVYGRNSRGSSYYIYAPTLVIIEA